MGGRFDPKKPSKRGKRDFYPTPPEVTASLLERESFSGDVWECAAGDGAMVQVLREYGYTVVASDIIDGTDFLRCSHRCDNIITNPPYGNLAAKFVIHARKLAREKVAMFLRLAFLESKSRYSLFKDTNFPLSRLYVMSSRVRLSPGGTETKSGMVPYAWFVWDRDHKGPAVPDWILL